MQLIATIGPRSSSTDIIDKIISGGACAIRINLSHGIYEEIEQAIKYIRNNYKDIKIVIDLQGNKIRVSKKIINTFKIREKDIVYFCSEDSYEDRLKTLKENFLIPLNIGKNHIVNSNIKKIYMKDGTMEFYIIKKDEDLIKAKVKIGGVVRQEKGCNLPGIDRKEWGLTEKDLSDIGFALKHKVDIICYSYCSYEHQCKKLKEEIFRQIKSNDKVPKIWGKIETKEGVRNINVLNKELDGIVIARGDLVPETNIFNIPIIQDKITHILKGKGKDIIVATNILNSMKFGLKPTINELSEIYSLMKNGVSGFILTGETTVGKNQREVVKLLKQAMEYYEGIINKAKKG